MRVFDADQKLRWLFCFTHPDDEIAICAWIRILTSHGVAVFLSWTHDTPVREAEARVFAEKVGVPEDHLFFHHAPDGLVLEEIEKLEGSFKKMIAAARPDRIACGAFEHGHLDHDATNFLVNCCYDGIVLEIPLYHTYLTWLQTINRFSDPKDQELLALTDEEQRFKAACCRLYPSQNIRSILVWYEIIRGLSFRPAELKATERMRLQTHKDFLTPNASPELAEKIEKSAKWARWTGVVGPLVRRAPVV